MSSVKPDFVELFQDLKQVMDTIPDELRMESPRAKDFVLAYLALEYDLKVYVGIGLHTGTVRNRKQVTNWIWIIVGILQSQSSHLSQMANYLPMATRAESRVTMIRRWLANLSSILATWLSSHPDRLDDCGRKRFGKSQQIEEHVRESATLFETLR